MNEQNQILKQERYLLKESLEDVSHQMKTPLTSLNLIVERLKDKELPIKERNELLKEEIYTDYKKVEEIQKEIDSLNLKIEELMMEWEEQQNIMLELS